MYWPSGHDSWHENTIDAPLKRLKVPQQLIDYRNDISGSSEGS